MLNVMPKFELSAQNSLFPLVRLGYANSPQLLRFDKLLLYYATGTTSIFI